MRTEKNIAYIVTALFSILLIRLCQLQVFKAGEFRRLSEENRLRILKVSSQRGIIYDRNGTPLVENRPYFCVSLEPEMLEEADLSAISSFLGISKEELTKRISLRKPFEPIRLKEGLSFQELAFISARLSDYPALRIDVDIRRHYIYGSVGAHVIGYLGKLNEEQAKLPELKDVPPSAFIGQWGIERLFDNTLRGIAGGKVIEVDALGRELRLIKEKPPQKGKDLFLSMDLNMQKEAERAFGSYAGALVALKPDTGEVLALVSKPSFDPNLFSKGINYNDWVALIEDKRFPMLNRALQSQYPPGSVFKIVTGISALETRSLSPQTTVTCTGGINVGEWNFRCWKKGGHGTLSFHRGLVESCDVYFYTAGKRTGIEALARYARELGVGVPSGMNLVSEKKGFMPDEQWKMKVKGQPWYLGETYNVAIGQGYVALTPLQVARLISAVSNGYIYELKLIKIETSTQPIKKLNVSDETLSVLRSALRGVVAELNGTGISARSLITEIAGKTGTAQIVSAESLLKARFRDHAWFAAYAPIEKPQVAVAVFVEHGGHGGSTAAPIAKKAIEAYLLRHED